MYERPQRAIVPGITLSWLEAFRIVPELAEMEVKRILAELECVKGELRTARDEIGYADVRARNADAYLNEALLSLGTGNNDAASRHVNTGRSFLAGGRPSE